MRTDVALPLEMEVMRELGLPKGHTIVGIKELFSLVVEMIANFSLPGFSRRARSMSMVRGACPIDVMDHYTKGTVTTTLELGVA